MSASIPSSRFTAEAAALHAAAEGDRLADGLRLAMRALRRLRAGPFASLDDADLAGHAHGLAYALRATRWQRATRQPSWAEVQAHWPQAGDEENPLCGTLAAGERWQLVTGNAEAFALRERLCASARTSIDVATFYLQADATGWRTARALIAAARRGVRVRLVADGWATRGKAYRDPQVWNLIAAMREAGVDCRLFADARRPFDACHRKLLLVDGESLLLGGRNHADHYAGDAWRDVELLVQGATARAVQPFFEETFTGTPGRHEAPPAGAVQPTTPAGLARNAFFMFLLQRARAAQATLDIENAYCLEHAVLRRELQAACARGVRVRLFTNSAESNDLPFMNHRLLASMAQLVEAGVQVYLRPGKGRTVHGKYFVADGEWLALGTSNLDYYSPRFCLELGLHLRDRTLGAALSAWFEEGIAQAQRIEDAASLAAQAGADTVGRLFDRWLRDIQ